MQNSAKIIESKIIKKFNLRFEPYPSIKRAIPDILKRLTEKDAGKQITLLSFFFRQSLGPNMADTIPDDLIIRLGVANLSGWIAYRIFDDFLDNQGNPELIPLAAVLLRDVVSEYQNILPKTFHSLFTSIMDGMDESNAWERQASHIPIQKMLQNQLPDYSNGAPLAAKSLPHCLGPIAILAHLGYKPDHLEVKTVRLFFHHYLIARQLNDDARDWFDDLRRGFVNSTASRVLKKLKTIKGLKPANKEQTLELMIPELVLTFKKDVAAEIILEINKNIILAKKALGKMQAFTNTNYFESLLAPLTPLPRKPVRYREG